MSKAVPAQSSMGRIIVVLCVQWTPDWFVNPLWKGGQRCVLFGKEQHTGFAVVCMCH